MYMYVTATLCTTNVNISNPERSCTHPPNLILITKSVLIQGVHEATWDIQPTYIFNKTQNVVRISAGEHAPLKAVQTPSRVYKAL